MPKEKIELLRDSNDILSEKINQFKESDQSWDIVEDFDNKKDEGSLEKIYEEKYKSNPECFFTDENLEYLATMTGGERLNLLASAAYSLFITPKMAEKYYSRFPADLEAVDKIFKFDRRNLDVRKYYLFCLSALSMDRSGLRVVERPDSYNYLMGDLEQYYGIARRRQEAPKFLLSNFKDMPMLEDFAEFGSAKDGLFETLKQASDYRYTASNLLNTKKMFSDEFEKLPEEDKARFLNKCLAYFQYFLLHNETYKSGFSPESVAYDERRTKMNKFSWGYDVAHSMIYKTYRPGKSYELQQGVFDHEMSSTADRGGDVEEYANHKMLLATLNRLKDIQVNQDETTKLVVELWNKNRNPIFANAIAETLSEQNVNLAAAQLLELLHSEKDKKEPIAAMLYRLEFGKIGISREGVQYLEKIYDLGDYNNPGYHASRLTSDGEMGIFNEELELIKYFHLGRLDTEEKRVKARVMDFTYDTLFIGRQGENEQEKNKREEYLTEFKKNYYQISEEQIFKTTGMRLNSLSFKEQGWFLIYFNQATEEEKKRLLNFVADYKEDGIKSFLSLEADQNLGEKIIDLGGRMDKESAAIVFHYLAEIVDLAEKENDELKNLFLKEGEATNLDWREIRLSLLRKTNDTINRCQQESQTRLNPETIKNLLNGLSKSGAEMLLLTSVLKEAKLSGETIDLEIIKDLSLDIKMYGERIKEKDKKEILNIAHDNWQSFGNQQMAKVVIDGLKESLINDQEQGVYILKYKGEVISFVRFEPTDHNTVYAGSFNVSKNLRGLSIGTEMMEKALIKESNANVLEATASIKIPAGCAYVEKIGFVADGLIENYHGTGESLYAIKLDQKNNGNYNLRHEGKDRPLSSEELKAAVNDYQNLDGLLGRPYLVLRFDLNRESSEYQAALGKLLPRVDDNMKPLEEKKGKYTLTRYFYDRQEDPEGNIRYLVFEKND